MIAVQITAYCSLCNCFSCCFQVVLHLCLSDYWLISNLYYYWTWKELAQKLNTDSNLSWGLRTGHWSCEATYRTSVLPHFGYITCLIKISQCI